MSSRSFFKSVKALYYARIVIKWVLIFYPVLVILPVAIVPLPSRSVPVSPVEEELSMYAKQAKPYFDAIAVVTMLMVFVLLPLLIVVLRRVSQALRCGPRGGKVDVAAWLYVYQRLSTRPSSGTVRAFADLRLAQLYYSCGEFDKSRQVLHRLELYSLTGQLPNGGVSKWFKVSHTTLGELVAKKDFLQFRVELFSGTPASRLHTIQHLRVSTPYSEDSIALCLALETIMINHEPHNRVNDWVAENGLEAVEKQYFMALNEQAKANTTGATRLFTPLTSMDQHLFFTQKAHEYLKQ